MLHAKLSMHTDSGIIFNKPYSIKDYHEKDTATSDRLT